MRTVVRNSFARQTITAERVTVLSPTAVEAGCTFCGNVRFRRTRALRAWLYRFHVDDDQGGRHSGTIAGGRLFCSRRCCEAYTGQPFDDTKGGR